MRETQRDPGDSYSRLLVINRDAFSEAHFEVAYHALAAALHAASDEVDQARVRSVKRIASEQREWIDTHRPEHRLSSISARKRGQHNIFALLEQQATAVGLLTRRKVEAEAPAP